MAKKQKSWAAIEAAYVRGKMSYREIAKKYDKAESTVSRYAKEHDWVGKRKNFRSKIGAKTIDKTIDKLSDKRSDELAAICDAATSVADIIKNAMEDPMQFNRKTVTTKEGHVKEIEVQSLNISAIKGLTGALKDLVTVIRDVYDIPKNESKKENCVLELILPEGCEGFDV